MTGPEHYREAERILAEIASLQDDLNRVGGAPVDQLFDYHVERAHDVARAQVHAILAVASPAGER